VRSIVDQLRERMGGMRPDCGRFATRTAIDDLVPHGSFRRGTLVELFGSAAVLGVVLAREALRPGGAVAVIDPARRFYPPAAASMGIDLARLIVVQPEEPDWIVIQALSCPAIDAVLCWPDRGHPAPSKYAGCRVDANMFRRWQLAAERGGSIGLLVRPLTARSGPSWADVQLVVTPLALGRWRLEVAGQGRSCEYCVEFSIDERGSIHDCLRMAAELAGPAAAFRAAGA
jgi:hypothetical protein